MGRFISEDPAGFGAGDTNLYRYVGNNSTNYTDPTGEYAQVGALAAGGAIFGGLGALFNDIETGQFGWNTIGNVIKGAAVGAVLGAAIGLGVGALAAGATTAFGTVAAGAAVETTFAFGFAAKSAYDAGGNFGEGRYLSGALDLVGVGLGAFQTAKGITRDIPGIIKQEAGVRAQVKIDTLNRVETGLDSLTNQTHVLSNIIESADARAGSRFGDFSRQANELSTLSETVRANIANLKGEGYSSGFRGFSSKTRPSLSPDPNRIPLGNRTVPEPNQKQITVIEDLLMENSSGDILSQNGYKVKQNPTSVELAALDYKYAGQKNPDYLIENKVFDHYTGRDNTIKNIRKGIKEKVSSGQTPRVVVNLDKSNVNLEFLKNNLNSKPMTGLEQVIVIKDNQVISLWP